MASSHPVVTHPYAVTLIRIKAKQLCRRTDFTRFEVEDLQQSMWAYLVEKAPLYDPQRATIEGFITHLVKMWVAQELRRRGREKRRQAYRIVSLDSTLIENDGDCVPMTSVLSKDDFLRRLGRSFKIQQDTVELREAIANAVSRLSPDQRALLADVVATDIKTAAKHRGLTWSTVRRQLNRMREVFLEDGIEPVER